MLFGFNDKIWLYPTPVDFRKQIDGLVILVSSHLECNPASGHLFLFRDRGAKKIKMLWWDGNGFWLLYKRLEKGRMKFPSSTQRSIELSRDQLHWLLSGLDCLKYSPLPIVKAENFY